MAISLFSHNETAYLVAASMLAETGRAAIVRPAGSGLMSMQGREHGGRGNRLLKGETDVS